MVIRLRCVIELEIEMNSLASAIDAIDGSLHHLIDPHKALVEIRGDAVDMPTQTEGDFLIRGAAEFQA